MLEPPFDIISCSWPRPMEHAHERWTSEPEWDAPLMPVLPNPNWEILHGELCWTINWRNLFRSGLRLWNHGMSGEMRGFHIVFRLKVKASGTFVFWEDDGSVIRRNGEVIHCDRSAHPIARHEIEVYAGDPLEVAQWQLGWDWLWGAYLRQPGQHASITPEDVLMPYQQAVQECLAHPNGPPLKVFTGGHAPSRTIVGIYSMLLNGYRPSAVHLFGEHQWNEGTRRLFATLLPFAHVIPSQHVASRMHGIGGPRLADIAWRYWFVMKTCSALLYPPEEFCFMDDDIFILDRVDDALDAFQRNDLVYTPDQDLSGGFLAAWRILGIRPEALHTRRLNSGLCWIRQIHDPRWVATQMLRARPTEGWDWEQGFIAIIYIPKNTFQLSSQRYFFPLLDGLPGGFLGYDYTRNPCGFASIHFAGLVDKPSDGIALQLAPAILSRHRR